MIGHILPAHAALRHGALEPTRTDRAVASKDTCTIKETQLGRAEGMRQISIQGPNTSIVCYET